MSRQRTPRLGVCSWSLQPTSPGDLAQKVGATGLGFVQLALDPIRRGEWGLGDTARALEAAGIAIASGMMEMAGEDYATLDSIRATGGVRPDATWGANLAAASANAELARDLGITLVTFHAGVLPDDQADAATVIDRIDQVAEAFADRGVRIAFETGQEPVGSLLDLLNRYDAGAVGVNFDPANMILYGTSDPIEAMRTLAPRIMQLHIKDATPTATPGTWGSETPAGEGAVDWGAFFGVYREASRACDLIIEREGGDARVEDVVKGRALVRSHLGDALS